MACSFASMHKIKLNDIRVELEGVLDTDDFMGKNKDAKIGFSKITSNFFIVATCPVHDTMTNSSEFETNVTVL
ncbi:OsmC family protein [Vagococcus lutrae]|uniref:OsmC family protein n=1 Tax=Vagococcus lutrae TaxID=81947 RepID=UPI0023A9C97A|nr:hypothetical protein [Vagococcus lutrae]WEB80699.1 hypothetical protein LVJ09_05640 [Vagococcus lutrae]